MHQMKLFKGLSDTTFHRPMNEIALCGDNEIKVVSRSNQETRSFTLDEGASNPSNAKYSPDASFLSVMSKDGRLFTFQAKSNILVSSHSTRIAYSRLAGQLTIYSADSKEYLATTLEGEYESLFIGSEYISLVKQATVLYLEFRPTLESNKDVLQYNYPERKSARPLELIPPKFKERKYQKKILRVETNQAYSLVYFYDYSVILHPLSPPYVELASINGTLDTLDDGMFFKEVEAALLTASFMIYSIQGLLHYYSLDELLVSHTFQSNLVITSIHSNNGTKLVLRAANGIDYIYSPINNIVAKLPALDGIQCYLWLDTTSQLLAYTTTDIFFYTFYEYTMNDHEIVSHASTELPFGYTPLLYSRDGILCMTLGGSLQSINPQASKEYDELTFKVLNEESQVAFLLSFHLMNTVRLPTLYKCQIQENVWLRLAERLLTLLELDMSISIYRYLGNAGMVMTLERIRNVEDRYLLKGHIHILFNNFAIAESCFLKSDSEGGRDYVEGGKEIVELYVSLSSWELALKMSLKYDGERVGSILLEYGLDAERQGKFSTAHSQYEKALDLVLDGVMREECRNGFIRMCFALGESTKGMKLLAHSKDHILIQECISFLLILKEFSQAALLYERIDDEENASECYIKLQKWNLVTSQKSRILILFAAAKEGMKDFDTALKMYEKALQYEDVVRILLDHFDDEEGSLEVVRKTKSRESARKLAARYTIKRQFERVIELYVIADLFSQAFDLAKQHNLVIYYSQLVISTDLQTQLGDYFCEMNDLLEAGRAYFNAKDFTKGLDCLLKYPACDESITLAIEIVGAAKQNAMTHLLITFLIASESQPKYVLQLYVSLGLYSDAAQISLAIAKEDQKKGNYRVAHDQLFTTHQLLQKHTVVIPHDLQRMLMLLHTYLQVKSIVSVDQRLAARLLVKVARNISLFPVHAVQILTMTVLQCQRSGMNEEMKEFAMVLMQADKRGEIDIKFKAQIELIVRRPTESAASEPMNYDKINCPYCDSTLDSTVLECPECKKALEYCVLSGCHVMRGDLARCKSCKFAISFKWFTNNQGGLEDCPMCYSKIEVELELLEDTFSGTNRSKKFDLRGESSFLVNLSDES